MIAEAAVSGVTRILTFAHCARTVCKCHQLLSTMETDYERRRYRLDALIKQYFHTDYDWIASVIEHGTGEKVSVRTIQAWLIAPNRKSSRNCPEWALKVMEKYVQDPSNTETIQIRNARYEVSVGALKSPLIWSDEVRSSRAVDFATRQIEEESRSLGKWQEEFSKRQGTLIFEMQRQLESANIAHMETLAAIHGALRTSNTFEEFREKFLEHERANDLTRSFVRRAKHAIENSLEEFADGGTAAQAPLTR